MLYSLKELKGFKISAADGNIGSVDDFYFDDKVWTIRYMVADSGGWLPGRLVLISPKSFGNPNYSEKLFPVMLTKEQIENSPSIDSDKPVSRQHESEIIAYYGWPNYWTGLGGSVIGAIPPATAVPTVTEEQIEKEKEAADPNLRNMKEVLGYNIHAEDGNIGHVEDFLFEENLWAIRYMVADTRNWLPGGKKVIVSLPWIENIDWEKSEVFVNVSKKKIENSPEVDTSKPVSRAYEEELHRHYEKEKYWK